MNVDQSISTCFRKYVTFSGRASRSEFWWFTLFVAAISFLIEVIEPRLVPDLTDPEYGGGLFSALWSLITLPPSLAVGARRLHDRGRSGWWQLLALTIIGTIWLLVWWARRGDEGPNRFGPQPDDVAPRPGAEPAAPWGAAPPPEASEAPRQDVASGIPRVPRNRPADRDPEG